MESLLVLIIEIVFVSVIIILLYHQKSSFGLVLLYMLIGSNQYFQTILSSSIYVKIFEDFYFSPGSVVLFASSIFAILLIYIKEGVHETRTLIYGILIVNIALTILSFITSSQINSEGTLNILNISNEIFDIDVKVFMVGTLTLIIDAILTIIVYEFLLFKIKRIKIFWTILITMFTILYVDSFVFTFLSYGGEDLFNDFLVGNIIGKSISGFLFAIILYVYIVFIDKEKYLEKFEINRNFKDIFSIVTYRERYEFLKVEKEQVEDLKNELITSNKNKDRFFSIISHDLRSPFSAILGFLTLMDSNIDSMSRVEIKRNLKLIHKSSENAFELLNNLLDWSRIQMDRYRINRERFCVNDLIYRSIDALMNSAKHKKIQINFTPSHEFFVYADANMIQSVVNNLLANAIKFTNTDGEINLFISEENNTVALKIKDNGVGIEKEVIDKLFKVDTAHSTRGTDNESGTGLGLILCFEFLKKNYGNISVKSEVNKGSTFTITLPNSQIDLDKKPSKIKMMAFNL